ncbi:hypothetical protein SAY87_000220 [Trapa incisa]|uniref:Chromatin target of PRMT1 protein C-terminal domain-containing protein n=1 Tax=Trapa incisa TaxID=236973 RepID=A0AAN7GI80_9MYRT|nr:hypothetical protein SAY87_000220 [Trapa incisa]
MRIEIVGVDSNVPEVAHLNYTGLNGWKKRAVVMPGQSSARAPATFNRGLGNKRLGGCFKKSRGRGGRQAIRDSGKRQQVEKSAEQLDKELESYHAGAMDTN